MTTPPLTDPLLAPEPDAVLVHLSDTHLTADRAPLHGSIDTDARLADALLRLPASGIRVDAILVTGDVADEGDDGAYTRARALLEPVADQLGARLVWVMGNHDARGPFRRALLDEDPADDDAPVDAVIDLDGLRLVVLDTSVPGHHHGELRPEQLERLAAELAHPAPRGTLLVMHHPPLPAPLDLMALTGLRDQDALERVVRGTDVRAILAGHLHYATHSTFAGVPVSAAAATCYTSDLLAPGGDLVGLDGGQGFDLVHVYGDRVLHSSIPVGAFPTAYATSAAAIRAFMALPPEQRAALAAQHAAG